MYFEFSKTGLTNNVVPVHNYIDSHCGIEALSSAVFVDLNVNLCSRTIHQRWEVWAIKRA